MSDKILVGTKLTGGIRIDLGKGKIVRPDIPVEMERAELMAIGGIEKMLRSGKLVILEPVAPPAPVEPPKAPEAPVDAVVEPEAPKPEKKAKKIRGLQANAVIVDEIAFFPGEATESQLESPPQSEEPKE